MSATVRKHISKYLEIQRHEIHKAKRQGEHDSVNNELEIDRTKFSGFMQDTIVAAKSQWSRYEASLNDSESTLTKQKTEHEYSINTDIPDDMANLEEKKRQNETLFESKEGKNSSGFIRIEEDLRTAKSDYDKIRAELNRPLLTKFEKIYIPFLAVLAFAEVPINRSAFELYFSSTPAVILVLALAIGCMLVFFAHSLGHLIKERTDHTTSISNNSNSTIGILSIVIVTVILMYFLAVMRQSYIAISKGAETFDELFTDTSKFDVFQDNLFQPLNSDGVGLLVLNFSIFFAGILASFFRHDSNSHYEKISSTYNKLRDKMAARKEKVEKRLSEIQEVYNKQLEILSNRKQNSSMQLGEINEELLKIFNQKSDDLKTVNANIERLLNSYESGYKSMMLEKPVPKVFNNSYSNIVELDLEVKNTK